MRLSPALVLLTGGVALGSAQESFTVGPRALGMGGTGVASVDDLPAQYHPNVNITEAPYNRVPGDAPALSEREIDDVLAFLNTLTDGFRP